MPSIAKWREEQRWRERGGKERGETETERQMERETEGERGRES